MELGERASSHLLRVSFCWCKRNKGLLYVLGLSKQGRICAGKALIRALPLRNADRGWTGTTSWPKHPHPKDLAVKIKSAADTGFCAEQKGQEGGGWEGTGCRPTSPTCGDAQDSNPNPLQQGVPTPTNTSDATGWCPLLAQPRTSFCPQQPQHHPSLRDYFIHSDSLPPVPGEQRHPVLLTQPLDLPGHQFSVQSLSRVRLFAAPWTAARQASLSITNSWSLLKLMSIESVMLSNHVSLSSPYPPAFNLSQHQGLFQ